MITLACLDSLGLLLLLETLTRWRTSTGCHSWPSAASLATSLKSPRRLAAECGALACLLGPNRPCKGWDRASPSNSKEQNSRKGGSGVIGLQPLHLRGGRRRIRNSSHSQSLSKSEARMSYKKEILSLKQKKSAKSLGFKSLLPGRAVDWCQSSNGYLPGPFNSQKHSCSTPY